MAGRRTDLPQSGVVGIRWSEAHGKWIVKTTVDGRDVYKGLYADLEEAKRVLNDLRLEHGDPHGRGHKDSTTRVSDRTLVERIALDFDEDPVWRQKPLTGDEATIRENARYNSRFAGVKLPERASFTHEGVYYQRLWRSDIVKRLITIREWQGRGMPPLVDASADFEEEPDVASPDLHGGGIPQDDVYTAKLAEAQAISDPLQREAQAAALEGEVIPPDPIGRGPLALTLLTTKRRLGLNNADLMVLSSGKDPFALDTPEGHKLGRWLMVRLDLHAPGRVIHLRGVHYLLVAVQARKPDGTPYENTREDYEWLNDKVGKAARWTRYIDFERIIDERNEEAIIARQPRIAAPIRTAYVSTGYTALTLPEPIKVWRAGPRPLLSGFQPEQKFCFAVFGEKSSLSPVLRPFGERHGADLYIAVGELSEARAYEMARDAVADGRKLVCFTFSDFDPSGMQMPVSIARKLQAQKELQFPHFDFIVQPVALTLDDVIRLRLPTAMVDKKDARRKRWQQRFAPPLIEAGLLPGSARWTEEDDADYAAERRGRLQKGEKRQAKPLAQVEIDALAAIYPEELDRIAEVAIAPYLDPTLVQRTAEAKTAWEREAQEALDRDVDRARLDLLSHAERLTVNRFNAQLRGLQRTLKRIDAIEARMAWHAEQVELPNAPRPPEAEERSNEASPLVDSEDGFARTTEALRDRKRYDDE